MSIARPTTWQGSGVNDEPPKIVGTLIIIIIINCCCFCLLDYSFVFDDFPF
jgi:hypothetical protein